MSKALQNAAAVATIVGLLFMIGQWYYHSSYTVASAFDVETHAYDYSPANLYISGAGAIVQVRKSRTAQPYGGGAVSSSGSTAVIRVPIGQPLAIDISGAGSRVEVESVLLDQVSISNRAAGATVHEF